MRKSYGRSEFGLDSIAEGCRIISHPNRLVKFSELEIDCPGTEFSKPGVSERSAQSLLFSFCNEEVRLNSRWTDITDKMYGSATGFVPSDLI